MTDLEKLVAEIADIAMQSIDVVIKQHNLEWVGEAEIGELRSAFTEEFLPYLETARAQGRIEGLQEALDIIDGDAIIEGTAIADDLEAAIRVRIQELQGKSE